MTRVISFHILPMASDCTKWGWIMIVPSELSATGLSRKDDFLKPIRGFFCNCEPRIDYKMLSMAGFWWYFSLFYDTSMRLLPPFLEKPHSVNALCIKEISPCFGPRMILWDFFREKKIYTCVGLAKPFSLSGLSKKHKYYYSNTRLLYKSKGW